MIFGIGANENKMRDKVIDIIEVVCNVEKTSEEERMLIKKYYVIPERFRVVPFSLSVRQWLAENHNVSLKSSLELTKSLLNKRWVTKDEDTGEYIYKERIENILKMGLEKEFSINIKVKNIDER